MAKTLILGPILARLGQIFILQYSAIREYPKSKIKKILKYKYNTINVVRNLQKTGVSFHQLPSASDT